MYRALCIEAKEYGPDAPDAPLHNCDFYESIEAGTKLAAGLSLGTSKHWSEALEAITGSKEISSEPILEYFAPLMVYMQEYIDSATSEEDEILVKLEEYNAEAVLKCNARSLASWKVDTNVGVESYVIEYQTAVSNYAEFRKNQYNSYFEEKIKNMKAGHYYNQELIRQLQLLNNMGTSLLEESDLNKLTSEKTAMASAYNSATICPYDDQGCATPSWSLDKEIQSRMSNSRDYNELEYIFNEWHDKSGKQMISNYEAYVKLMNKAALVNGYDDAGEMWISTYEDVNFKANIDRLWDQVKPLYDELHKYVKHKLSKLYPGKLDANADTIPAHILGNMWAQTWEDLYEDLKPYKNAGSINVDEKMLEKGYDVRQMFEMSDDFYKSMGLKSNDMSYRVPPAMIEKPDDRIVACHASAWDFCDGEDFRIKMCTHVDMHDFLVVHHEMGHIQYYLQYKDNPLTLRGGANPGFHEAVGDTIALSVDTAKRLRKVGLLGDDYIESKESEINALFAMALKRVAFLPFGLLIDKWRWEVFSGAVEQKDWNKRWWELRKEYQKVAPPTNRDSAEYFDPGAKFHVPNDSQYIAYFVAHILEFQMYRALCIEAKEYGPDAPGALLHNCDFYESTEAGTKLAAGLSLGTSKHWSKALEAITGSKEISSEPILEYFDPLLKYLKKYNNAIENIENYNRVAPQECNKIVKAEWDVNTDVENEAKQSLLSSVTLTYSQFLREQANIFEDVKPEDFDDESEQRQIREIKKLGTAILEATDLSELQATISGMEKIYNTATICPFGDTECETRWTLDPEMEARLATSTDYDELQYVWKEWRDNSGKKMREHYKKYVRLSNKAAVANGYHDYGEMWRDSYEDDKFDENIERMWNEVKELYDELHTYVLKKLKKIYGTRLNAYKTTIPAHLLGNMWAQSWVHLYDRIRPYTNGSLIDVTDAIKSKYTVKEMFEEADQFYIRLGLEPMPMSYDDKLALISKPEDRKVACHASAWDFCDGEDFRIKMCTNLNMEDFVTIHHELGHIQYYLLYKDLPIALRGGANPGFHEAVGDLIALSVSTPQHLQKIDLLEDYKDSHENDINSLFKMALERVAFLPFGLLIDKWRWDVFSGKVNEDNWNAYWWELRGKYQKVVAPVERSEEDFDPGAKYHVPADSKYISYFIAHILEFQLHRALCIEAGQYDPEDETKPLFRCDIDKSEQAGKKIRDGLSLGFSKHWSESLKAITGETEISGEALMEYFAPLLKFLKEQNAKDDDGAKEDDDDDAGTIIGGDKGIVISIALIIYGIYSWARS
jgi:peptidyl-dipeptidase A